MTLQVWWALLGACVVIALTPGAGAVNTMTNSINAGWRHSFWGITGQELALLIQIAIVAIGVGALIAASPGVLTTIRWVGAGYLVYLGIRLILAKPRPAAEIAERPRDTAGTLFRRGILVNLLNPKAVVFFLAFAPQFIRPGAAQLPQYAIFAATCVVVDIIVMWFGYAALARPLRLLMSRTTGQRIIGGLFGSCFILVAGLLLVLD